MTDKYIEDQGGHRVHYTVNCLNRGPLKPVVLLHGFTENVFVWDSLSRYLCEKGYCVICVDLAGHGKTDSVGSTHGMGLQALIVRSVFEAEGIRKAVVIGHSMGGYVACEFAARYPELLLGLGLFHSSAQADTEESKQNRQRMVDLIEAGKTYFIGDSTPDLFAPGMAERYPEALEALVASAKSMDPMAVAAAQRGMMERQNRLEIYSLPIPFLFIVGKLDSRANLPQMLVQASMPQRSHLLLLPVGHMGMFEAPKATESFVAGYLDGLDWE